VTDWPAFAGIVGVVLAALLVLARHSTAVTDAPAADASGADRRSPSPPSGPGPGPGVLLANVALSQALLGALVLAGAWLTRVPPAALGLGADGVATALGTGIALGAALYALNAVGTVLFGDRLGDGTALRRALTPATGRGWLALLGVVLPVVAGVEELLFRGVLIGALGAGFGLPAPALVAGSSVAFALGHGAQGRAGMVVTGALGAVLGAAFALTGSLLAVVVAHYLVNALEFVVHEGLGVDLPRR
jgi:membrane protease YdiL (CAAX protease family)